MRIQMVGKTDVGRVRKMNQDSFYCNGSQGFAVVADGIGGRKGGEVASKIAVDGLKKAFVSIDRLRHEEVTPFLSNAVDMVNSDIIRTGHEIGKAGMGTTMNCLMFVGDRLNIAHIGDSRTYLYYQGSLWQLTLDHSLKTYLDRGWMNRSELSPGVREEALVRSLGLTERCEVDIYDIKLKADEIFITCSDGLSSMISDRKIAKVITENLGDLESMTDRLIEEANRAGGKDNVTVVVSKVKAA